MAVSENDVRHIAQLARLRFDEKHLGELVQQLNGILGHMDVLRAVDTTGVEAAEGIGANGTPLRTDRGPGTPLVHPLESFAPELRDGFILVPRLASHEETESA
jgi:aspartyl-tRNA(Asn)/glutamyl-tRNA(Gln) amidotransferase subunit C